MEKPRFDDVKSILWDRKRANEFTLIERVIQYGPERLVGELEKRFGREKIVFVLRKSRSLSKRIVNYWCLIYHIERDDTYAFSPEREDITVWEPFY